MSYQGKISPDTGRTGTVMLLRRDWTTVLASMVLGLASVLALCRVVPPSYEAEAALSLDTGQVQILPADALIAPRSQDGPNLRTEMDVIGSRGMAGRVAARLGTLPGEVSSGGSLAAVVRLLPPAWPTPGVRAWLAGLAGPATGPTAPPTAGAMEDWLLHGLKVSNDGRSSTIYIDFTAHDAGLAARVANLYADEYVAQEAEHRRATSADAATWLGGKLSDLRKTVETSETAAQAYRRSIGLLDPGSLSLQSQTLSDLNVELASARAARLGAEARLQTVSALRQAGGDVEAFQDVLASPVVQELRKDESQTARSIHELEAGGAAKSLQLPALRLHMASIQQQIDAEVSRIIGGLGDEVAVARSKESQLEQAFAEAKKRSADASDATVHLNQLEREATASRSVYESFLTRYKQSIEQENIPVSAARLLSRATPSSVPSSPRPVPLALLGLLGGGLLGLGVSVLRNHLHGAVRTAGEFESIGRVPVLGLVPAGRGRYRSAFRRSAGPAKRRALRRLEATLRLNQLTRRAKVLALVSVDPGRDAGLLCLDLARATADGGRSVILVEAGAEATGKGRRGTDLAARTGQGVPGSPSRAEIDEATRVDTLSGVRLLSLDRLSSFPDSWPSLIAQLRASHEVVLIHASALPECPAAEAVLSAADRTVLVGHLGRTDRQEVAALVHHLTLCSIPLAGLVAIGSDTPFEADRHEWSVPAPAAPEGAVGRRSGRPVRRMLEADARPVRALS